MERNRRLNCSLRGLEIGKTPDVSNPILLRVDVSGVVSMPPVCFHNMAQMPFAVVKRTEVL